VSEAKALRFRVITAADIECGSTIAYLVETTGVQIESIHLDLMTHFARRPDRPVPARRRWYRDPALLRSHLMLARVMPRHYLFMLLKRIAGTSELELLRRAERRSPALLRRLAGFELPAPPSGGRLLHRLDDVARCYGIPLFRTPSLNSDETVADFAADPPDVVLGLGTRILSARLLSTARIGFLNKHSSLLPEYRGGVTEFWQLAAGERETGITIHWMSPAVDEGALVAQRRWPIPPGSDHHRLRLMSFFNGLPLWRDVIRDLLDGRVRREPQPAARTPTYRAPTLEQQVELYCRGRRPAV
jgi:hypothetical protein